MKHLCRTTAIALAMGGLAMGAANAAGNSASMNDSNGQQMASTGVSNSYCKKPWAKVDTDNNGFVSRQEANKAADMQFKAIDSNGDGKITKEEYRACMNAFGSEKSAMTDRNAENFKKADVNNDQKISANEYRDMAKQSYEALQRAEKSDDANAQPFVVLRRYVWLTPQESKDAQAMKNMSKDEAAARSAFNFDALDTNNDGQVSVEEWRQRSATPKRDEQTADAKFDKMDQDKSGSVNEDEYKSAQANKVDQTTTASTNTSNADSDVQVESAVNEQAADHKDTGSVETPVYVYRFLVY